MTIYGISHLHIDIIRPSKYLTCHSFGFPDYYVPKTCENCLLFTERLHLPSLTEHTTSSPEDLEDSSDKGAEECVELEQGDQGAEQEEEDVNVEVEEEVMDDHVERIFVPEHKNQATSPGHPMAQCEVEEEYAVVVNAAASDVEVTIQS